MIRNSHGGAPHQRRVHLIVLIDALGWKFLEGNDFLADVLPHRQALRTVLGFSSGAIPTILTGVFPSQHGHWNLYYYDPKGSPFRWLRYFRFLPDSILDNRVSRKIVKELGRRVLGMGPLFECCVSPRWMPYFNWVEKRNIYDRGGISGALSIFDQFAKAGFEYRVYSYHHSTDASILSQARHDINHTDAQFFFLYLSEMDMFLHMNCNDPGRVQERLQWYERGLREVLQTARRIDPGATMTVISDHGMTPVANHFDLTGSIDALRLKMPQDYLAVYDSTMARYWFFSDRARKSVRECLERLSCGRIVEDDELRRLGIFFDDRRFGELIFLLKPGWLVSKGDFNGKGWMPLGMHGYDPADPYSDAIFLSSEPPSHPVSSIADVHALMKERANFDSTLSENPDQARSEAVHS